MKPNDYLKVFQRVAAKHGWELNNDEDLLLSFAEGLLVNRERYGAPYCPCRLTTGKKEVDQRITCPCIYASDDIKEYNRCYCGLYVSKDYQESDIGATAPERHFPYYLD